MKKRRQQGQVVLLMGLMTTTFVIMFGLVVSIGHLVQAKINLQNAVDLAAMAGASYQARYLDHLAQINYRFRQNFKWVLFDLYFTQSRFNQGLQNALASGNGNPYQMMSNSFLDITFGICQQSYGYVPYPAAGEEPGKRLKDDFHLCKNVTGTGVGKFIPKFAPSPVFVPDPRIIITNLAIQKLAQEAEDIFRVGSNNNELYFRYAINQLQIRQAHQLDQFNAVLGQMQGAFGNAPGVIDGNAAGDAVVLRTFQENLINANLNAELKYMNPKSTLALSPSDFDRSSVDFDFYVIQFNSVGGGVETRPVKVHSGGVPIGMSRKRDGTDERFPANPVMVVLKATARPKLLFWPRELTPTISAVSVARPFGSKIGPPRSIYLDENPALGGSQLANMSLFVGDTWANAGTQIPGIGHINFGRLVYNLLPHGVGSGRNELRPDASGSCPNSFGCMARAPTQYEGIMFNIFPDSQGGPQYQLAKSDLGFSTAVGTDGYVLLDRPGILSGLHRVEFAGIAPYYATAQSAATSWAPQEALKTPGDRRVGYSIKLLSVDQACNELALSGAASGAELGYFCQSGKRPLH